MIVTKTSGRTVRFGPQHRPNQMRLQADSKDVAIDQWTTKIFSIIDGGPSGGFVRYAINTRNELYVERTGNRREVQELVDELLPKDACRYVAYKLKYQKGSCETARVCWFVWTPESAPTEEPTKYLNALAGTLIGLNCASTIPILNGKSTNDYNPETILEQIRSR